MNGVILFDTSKLKDYEYPKIGERFYRETAYHELTVLHDDGVYRHLRMMPPKDRSSFYWYDVVTWPGNLAFRGDGESFVFSRLHDMLGFFRSGLYQDGSIHINASYWAEKLSSNRECVMTYDDEKFSKYVKGILDEVEEEYPGVTKAWEEATEGFCASYDITHEQGAWEALNNFSYERWRGACSCGSGTEEESRYDVQSWGCDNGHLANNTAPKPGHKLEITSRTFAFELSDIEGGFKDYDWWFLWSLYGIVKAIKAYDAVKGYGPPVDVAEAGRAVLIG